MNDEILKLAKEFDSHCITEYDNGTKYECFEFTAEELVKFYKAAFNAGLEAAIKQADHFYIEAELRKLEMK